MTTKADHSKAKILAAAVTLLERDGARTLTLDKVAQEAGVSKGGLTHHFKSKPDLFLGLLDMVIATIKDQLAEQLAREPKDAPGRLTRAYMNCNLTTIRNGEAQSMRGLIEMVLAMPDLVAKRRQGLLEVHAAIEQDGLDPVQASALAAASDGCWMNVLMGLWAPQDPRVESVHAYLMALSRKAEVAR